MFGVDVGRRRVVAMSTVTQVQAVARTGCRHSPRVCPTGLRYCVEGIRLSVRWQGNASQKGAVTSKCLSRSRNIDHTSHGTKITCRQHSGGGGGIITVDGTPGWSSAITSAMVTSWRLAPPKGLFRYRLCVAPMQTSKQRRRNGRGTQID